MKVLINSVLALCALALLYLCYGSIMGPIEFDKERDLREKAKEFMIEENAIGFFDREDESRRNYNYLCR